MPIYPHVCNGCAHDFEVVKSLKDFDNTEYCPLCNTDAKKVIALRQSIDKSAASDWNRLEYNPGLGSAYTPKQASKEAKRRGLVEVGNEPIEKIHKHYDKERSDNARTRYD